MAGQGRLVRTRKTVTSAATGIRGALALGHHNHLLAYGTLVRGPSFRIRFVLSSARIKVALLTQLGSLLACNRLLSNVCGRLFTRVILPSPRGFVGSPTI